MPDTESKNRGRTTKTRGSDFTIMSQEILTDYIGENMKIVWQDTNSTAMTRNGKITRIDQSNLVFESENANGEPLEEIIFLPRIIRIQKIQER